jgi:hypothetical protein
MQHYALFRLTSGKTLAVFPLRHAVLLCFFRNVLAIKIAAFSGDILTPQCDLNVAKISTLSETSKLFRKKVTYRG